MRKVLFALICVILLIQLSSCADKVYYTKSGIENFNYNDSNAALTQSLMPKGFLELYDYVDGDYEYGELSYLWAREMAIVSVLYDADVYTQAKQYILEHMDIADESETYSGYTFAQSVVSKEDIRVFVGYCDQARILVFLGTRMSGDYDYQYQSFDEYVSTYFSFFDFEKGEINKKQYESYLESLYPQKATKTEDDSRTGDVSQFDN